MTLALIPLNTTIPPNPGSRKKTHDRRCLLWLIAFLYMGALAMTPPETRVEWYINEIPLRTTKDTLRYAISGNSRDYFLYRTEPMGYQLEMIRHFAGAYDCRYHIDIVPAADERRQQLTDGAVDIMVCSRADYFSQVHGCYPTAAFVLPDSSVWVVDAHNREMIGLLSRWTTHVHSVCQSLSPPRYIWQPSGDALSPCRALSPYDDLIRKYARQLRWDWRLLAALICQESHFRPDIVSPRGAYGLMQVMPATAAGFDIPDFTEPEDNIRTGVRLLAFLHNDPSLSAADEQNRLKFILAAYNAGLHRIGECRTFAQSQQKDPNRWDEVAAAIPLMRHKLHYTGEHIPSGRFNGVETLNFVQNVWERYEHYRNLVAE
ncbi:MAG: transglycosylase SLT domain-containing protein [Prevotellaceae bacterium]|jgi:membrane-bound lytic murein transglycosylase MltF|nr:transglycosylase SLT domain-containing protein [Prevotellaceae bacterium]